MFISVYLLLKKHLAQTERIENRVRSLGEHLFPLFMASLVETFSAAAFCAGSCPGTIAYAVTVGVVSALVCIVLAVLGKRIPQKARRVVGAILIAWWTTALFILTMDEPFTFTGNGYFSVWISMFLSALYLEAQSHET